MLPLDPIIDLARTTPYPVEAFLWVQRGLDFTVRRIHGEATDEEVLLLQEAADAADHQAAGQDVPEPVTDSSRHISGQQLCEGLRDFAILQYGLLARSVLRHLRIVRCEDFGTIVFAMVDAGMMNKTDRDTIDDFRDVFDFAQAFEQPTVQGVSG